MCEQGNCTLRPIQCLNMHNYFDAFGKYVGVSQQMEAGELYLQVGYEGADMSTGIGPLSRLRGPSAAASANPVADCSSAKAVGALAKAEAQSRQSLAQAANSRQQRTVDKDDLHEMGLM